LIRRNGEHTPHEAVNKPPSSKKEEQTTSIERIIKKLVLIARIVLPFFESLRLFFDA
jgi:hypothetical protein